MSDLLAIYRNQTTNNKFNVNNKNKTTQQKVHTDKNDKQPQQNKVIEVKTKNKYITKDLLQIILFPTLFVLSEIILYKFLFKKIKLRKPPEKDHFKVITIDDADVIVDNEWVPPSKRNKPKNPIKYIISKQDGTFLYLTEEEYNKLQKKTNAMFKH